MYFFTGKILNLEVTYHIIRRQAFNLYTCALHLFLTGSKNIYNQYIFIEMCKFESTSLHILLQIAIKYVYGHVYAFKIFKINK